MTVEAAIALGLIMGVLALAFAGIAAMTAHLRCVDAAREAARLVARGDGQLALEAAATIAPSGANVRITTEGDRISVEVSLAPAGGFLSGLAITGAAFAVAEPEVAG